MGTLILIFINLFNIILISIIKSVIINDVTYVDEPVLGKIYSELYINQLGVTTEGNCDHRRWFGFTGCDFESIGRICTILMNYSREEIAIFMDYKEPSFRRNHDGDITYKTLHYLVCGDTGTVTEPDDTNYIDYGDKPKLLCNYLRYYSDHLHITAILFERGGFETTFIRVYITTILQIVDITKTQFLNKTTYSTTGEVEGETYIFKLFSKEKCLDHYTGFHCWFYCANSETHNCSCTKISENDVQCEITCNPGYSYRYISYKVGESRQAKKKCDLIDRCQESCIHFCLVTGNGTFYCEQPSFWMLSNLNKGQNISSPVFYYGEILVLKPSLKNFSLEFQYNHYLVLMEFNESNFMPEYADYYERSYKPNEMYLTKVNLKVKESILLEYTMYFIDWEKEINYQNYFYFFYPLLEVSIINTKMQETLSKIIVLGDTINCNSSGYPYYAILYAWASSIITFTFPLYQNQTLNQKLDLNNIKLRCIARLLVPKRNMMVINNTLSLNVKAFYHFDWSTTKRFLYHNESVNCSVHTNIDFTLTIYELGFDSDVKIKDNIIIFEDAPGDAYSFYCILITEYGFLYSRFATFFLLETPSYVCFYLFPHVPGGVAQCGHNGYFQDDFTINVSFYSSKLSVFIEGNRYVRIPYHTFEDQFTISCSIIQNSTLEQILNHTLTSKLLSGAYGKYSNTDNCTRYYPYVEYPEIVAIFDDVIILAHYMFFIKFEDVDIEDYLFYIFCVLFFCNIPIIMIYAVVYVDSTPLYAKIHFYNILLVLVRKRVRSKLYAETLLLVHNFNIKQHMDKLMTKYSTDTDKDTDSEPSEKPIIKV